MKSHHFLTPLFVMAEAVFYKRRIEFHMFSLKSVKNACLLSHQISVKDHKFSGIVARKNRTKQKNHIILM